MIDRPLLHYKIVSQIGAGGMGVVYKAWDEHLDRFVAIKVLRPDMVDHPERRLRFIREAKAVSTLNHPNIITIHDVASDGETYFIVMEYVEGHTLKKLIVPGGMPVEVFLQLGVQIADAVASAHERGVIHRDLKPANILVAADNRVKIVDFGLAKLLDYEQGVDTTVTAEGAVLGTAPYMSPEQVQGLPVGPASDMFAMGVVFYEMLAGRRPFVGPTSAAIMAAILQKDPIPLRGKREGFPPQLEPLVFGCLRKQVQHRIQNAFHVKEALDAMRASGSKVSFHTWLPVPSETPSLAVLPFGNLSADKDNDYFSDGLAEEIINALTRVPDLRVIARASSFAFRGPNYDIAAIGEKLRVGYILDGGVRKIGDRIRVTASLIKVDDESQVWSERFDRMMTDIFEIQDEISAAIVEKLKSQLTSDGATAKPRPRTTDVEAFKLYLKGRFYWNRRGWADLSRGVDCFNEALRLDPVYADAYVGIADSYNLLGYYNERPPKDAFSLSKAAATRALEIDPLNAGAHATRGFSSLFFDWNWPRAGEELRRAVELDTDNARAHHWHAWYYFVQRQHSEGIAAMERAHDRDPLAPIVNDHLALSYSLAGLHEEALQQLRQTIELDPNFFLAHYRMGWVWLHKSEPENAIAPLERAVELSGGRCAAGLLGYAYGLAGRAEKAEEVGRLLEAEALTRYISPIEKALVRGGLGNLDGAFTALDQALGDRACDLVLFHSYPWTAAIRDDPRFARIAHRVGLD